MATCEAIESTCTLSNSAVTEMANNRTRLNVGAIPVAVSLPVTVLLVVGCVARGIPNSPAGEGAGSFPLLPVWTLEVPDPITATSSTAGGMIYARTARELIQIEAGRGKRQWAAPSASDTPLSFQPIVGSGLVIVPEVGSRLAAFEETTGALSWRTPALVEAGTTSPRVEAIAQAGDLIVVARFNWSLAAYSIDDGVLRWERRVSSRAPLFMVADERRVFVGLGENVSAYEARSGILKWTNEINGYAGPMLLSDDILYVADEREPGVLALVSDTGTTLWRQSLSQLEPYDLECLAASPKSIYVAESKVVALSKTDGQAEWLSRVLGRLECPVTLDGVVYVRNTDTTLFALDSRTGDLRGTLEVPYNTAMKNEPDRGPSLAGPLLIVPLSDRRIGAFQQ